MCTTFIKLRLYNFQQYFSYIVVVIFIGGGNRSNRRKLPICCKSLTIYNRHSKLLLVIHSILLRNAEAWDRVVKSRSHLTTNLRSYTQYHLSGLQTPNHGRVIHMWVRYDCPGFYSPMMSGGHDRPETLLKVTLNTNNRSQASEYCHWSNTFGEKCNVVSL